MNYSSRLVNSAVSIAIAIGVSTFAAQSYAAHEGEEQCAGIVKAGKNDCATRSNQCHGHVTSDADPDAWVYLPQGTCARLVGAHVVSVVDPTPAR